MRQLEEKHPAGLDVVQSMKLIRDIARLIRLPLFIRNVFAIWQWHSQARQKLAE